MIGSGKSECGSGTRRRPIRQDYAAAKDAEVGIGKWEVGMWKWEMGSGNDWKWEVGMRKWEGRKRIGQSA
jgi:hypothetical protein